MADNHSSDVRGKNMFHVRSRNTKEEIVKKYLQKEKNILGKWQHRVYRTQRYVIVLLYETAYKVLKA